MAIIKCVKEWNRGFKKPFTILTDHKNLEPFTTKKVLNEGQVRWMELLTSLLFKIKNRPGKLSIIPHALYKREQDVHKDSSDAQIALKERTPLPNSLWINNLSVADLICPFQDNGQLKLLWNQALNSQEEERFLKVYSVVQNQERQSPADLNLKISIGEFSFSSKILYYRKRILPPTFEPLTTSIIQKSNNSFLSGHLGRDATIGLVTRKFF